MNDFAEFARAALHEQGLSVRRAARAVNYDHGYLVRVLNGKQTPSAKLAAALDDLLRANGQLAELAKDAPPRAAFPSLTLTGDAVSMGPLAQDVVNYLASGRRVGRSTARDLAARAHGLRLADDVLAGGDLIGPAFRELNAAVRVVQEAASVDSVRRELLCAVAEIAQIAGWVASDAADPRAVATYRLGLDAAREAGDRQLAAQLASSLAYHWSNGGRVTDAVELSTAAVAEVGRDGSRKARALFHDRAAWSLTKAKGTQAAMRSLAAAHEALAEADDVHAPEWAYWVTKTELQVMDARVYTELRKPLRAIPLLDQALRVYPATATRERALYESWLAVAYADANEPEEAARVAARVVDLSCDVASSRASDRVRVVLSRLTEFRDVSEVREVIDAVRSRVYPSKLGET